MNHDLLTATFRKQFPGGPAIAVDQLRLGSGITVLFGASGSGKTTVLRCLAGLERPEAGRIQAGRETWFDGATNLFLPARRRRVGFVPQDYALFPHLSVARNVGYGLNELTTGERARQVAETLEWLGLTGLEDRLPRALSGGQQQRVALARAVVGRPQLLLLDEPFAALDTPTRLRLRGELRHWLRHTGIPTLLVTHDRFEALALGDEVVILHEGRNVQQGPVPEVFGQPFNLAVAEITAVETVQRGRLLEVRDGLATIAVGNARLTALARDLPADASEVHVCIRAEDVILTGADAVQSSARNHLSASVHAITRAGPLALVQVDCGFPLMALLTQVACDEMGLHPGHPLVAIVKAPKIHLISADNAKDRD